MLEDGPADVPTDHRWNSETYVAEWAASANDAPHRDAMFDAFVSELSDLAGAGELRIELGSGPGYLAEQICSRADAGYAHPRCLLDLGRVALVGAERRR